MSRASTKAAEAAVAATVAALLGDVRTYGQLEALAGISDRDGFWAGHRSEASARAALTDLVRARVEAKIIPK